MILETERLALRRLEETDFDALAAILQDPQVMYAYEHGFSTEEVRQWLDRQLERYAEYGFGLWAVLDKTSGELIGQCGITMQDWNGRNVPEIGYHLRRDKWHQGFAIEAAKTCNELSHRHAPPGVLRQEGQVMTVTLGERTAETAAVYFERTRTPAIQKMLPQKAQTLEEALADFQKTREPGTRRRPVCWGRVVLRDGPGRRAAGDGELLRV